MSYFEFDGTRDTIGEIGMQFRNNNSRIAVSVFGHDVELDYCIVGKGSEDDKNPPIVLVTGFGSGWRGIAELAYYLAILDRTVVLVSLPGYGNSGDLSVEVYSPESFSIEARSLIAFYAKVLKCRKAHWIGHSMGAAIITELACVHPGAVSSLTLLNPCGFEKLRSGLWLALKFVACGIMHRLTFRGYSAWKDLEKFLPEEKSPFCKKRLPLRLLEIKKMVSGYSGWRFNKLSRAIPVAFISGEKDFVVPPKKSVLKNGPLLHRERSIEILPMWHNTTMLGSNLTANAIIKFILEVEK